jgi:hypothetical protein
LRWLFSAVGKLLSPARFVARQDHRDFVVERELLLEDAGLALELLESGDRLRRDWPPPLAPCRRSRSGRPSGCREKAVVGLAQVVFMVDCGEAACGRPLSRRKFFSAMRFWQTLTAAADGRTRTNLFR